jgi:hypothetical protein
LNFSNSIGSILIEECASFPNAAYDDQVDAMTQALNRMRVPSVVPNIRLLWDEEDPLDVSGPHWTKAWPSRW